MSARDLFSSLNRRHPRLFLTPQRMKVLQAGGEATPTSLKTSLLRQADKLLELEASEFRIVGPRMLVRCQQVLWRVATLALAFRISVRAEYLDRAKTELFAAADFPHWNPEHFLDTAELCTAFAIGYDWLHDSLSDSDQRQIRSALVEKGLLPGLQNQEKPAWWVSVRHNWNTVCHGGLAVGALAVADEEPELAAKILDSSLAKMPLAQESFAPDGAWEAGPHYWEYTAWYSALTCDALITALGTDASLSDWPGFHLAGLFALHCAGSSGKYFNYSDADDTVSARPALFWLGKRFNLPSCIAEYHRDLQSQRETHPFDLIWYEPLPEQIPDLPAAVHFRGSEVVFMRGSWDDPEVAFVGFKAGSGQTDHAHLDLGSFVFDVTGIRWAVDLGPDDYDLPGYWNSGQQGERWKYFRLSNHSHNTLVLNGQLQNPLASTMICRKNLNCPPRFAIADLSSAYADNVQSAHRGIALLDTHGILIQDEIVWRPDIKKRLLRWQMTTDANIVLHGANAILTKNGRSLEARILSPQGASLSTASAHRDKPENPNTGYQQLIVEHDERTPETRVVVQLSTQATAGAVRPLSEW